MQESPGRSGAAPANPWIYTRSSSPKFRQVERQYRDAEYRQPAPLTSQFSQNSYSTSELFETCQNPSLTEPLSTQQNEVSISFPEMVTHLQVALRASERARKEGCNESSALRRYLADVEVAAAGLVSRVQELEHLLTLSTASQENKDLDQLRGQMLIVTARDARQHAIAAAQTISTARQVKREASALTASQEEEIKRLSTELQRSLDLLQKKDILLHEREHEEEKLMHRCSALEGALNVSQLELSALRKEIEVMNKEDEEKELRFQEIVQTLEFTKAAARATEHRLQEAQTQEKDTAIQNELLQHEVVELQSREVQTTIAHYDLELRKVRAVLEGEKTHLLAELAKLRQGNQSLKGEVAEWRGKYNNMVKKTSCCDELVRTTFEPAEMSFARLREFFSTECLEEGSFMNRDSINGALKERTKSGGIVPTSQVSNRSERQDTPDSQQIDLVRNDEEHRNTQLCATGGENIHEDVNASRLNFQERNQGRAEPLLISDKSENDRFYISERKDSACFDNQLCLLDSRNSENGQICLAGKGQVEHGFLCRLVSPLGPVLEANKPVEGREIYLDSKGSLEAQGRGNNAKKLRSVSFVDQLTCGPEGGILALKDETCFEMGENLLAVAHRELCKLKRINQQLVAASQ